MNQAGDSHLRSFTGHSEFITDQFNKILSKAIKNEITLHNVCAVHRGCAVQRGIFSTPGDIIEYTGVFSTLGNIMSTSGLFSTVGDTMSTAGIS